MLVRTLLIGQSLALICFTVVVPIEVIYAKESLGHHERRLRRPAERLGRRHRDRQPAVRRAQEPLRLRADRRLDARSIGLAYLGMSQAHTLLVACAMSVVGGIGNGVQWVAVMTALQESTPAEYQARMSGLLESIGAAMPGVGYLLGGVLVALGSPRTAFAFAGVGMLVLVVGALILRPATSVRPRRRPATPSGGA